MSRGLHALLFCLVLASLLIGCTRCQDCDMNGSSETICETEFDSPGQYDDAVADREAAGAICTATGGI